MFSSAANGKLDQHEPLFPKTKLDSGLVEVSATLEHRGEHFKVAIDGVVYTGLCVWSWDGEKRTYPVFLEAKSIRREPPAKKSLRPEEKLEVARLAKEALERADDGGKYEVAP